MRGSLRAHGKRSDPSAPGLRLLAPRPAAVPWPPLSADDAHCSMRTSADVPAEPLERAPIFRNRSSAPYSKDTVGDDFRVVRIMVFGADGNSTARRLSPLRHVEALAGRRRASATFGARWPTPSQRQTRLHKHLRPSGARFRARCRRCPASAEAARCENKKRRKVSERRPESV